MNISLPAVPISLSRYSGRGSWLGDRECGRKGIFNGRKKIGGKGHKYFKLSNGKQFKQVVIKIYGGR